MNNYIRLQKIQKNKPKKKIKDLENLDIIAVLMKNDRVREFEWLDTRR